MLSIFLQYFIFFTSLSYCTGHNLHCYIRIAIYDVIFIEFNFSLLFNEFQTMKTASPYNSNLKVLMIFVTEWIFRQYLSF